jgi:hypothetical protein
MIRDFETEDFLDVKHYKVADVISSYGPYRFFVTLTFQRPVDDVSALRHGEVFIGRLHKRLFGRYKWRSVKPLSGVVMLERKDVRKKRRCSAQSSSVEPVSVSKTQWIRDRGNCHFHFLLHWHPELGGKLVEALRRLEVAVGKAAMGLNYSKTESLVSKDGFRVKLAVDRGAINYVSKEAKYLSWWMEDRLFLFRRTEDFEFEFVSCNIPLKRWWNMPVDNLRTL